MGFLHPELLILLVPAIAAGWRWRGSGRATPAIRLLVLVLLVLALAEPTVRTAATGRDLVLLVDRSRSMPAEAGPTSLEIARLAEEERTPGDRVAVVAFGTKPAIERLPSGEGRFSGFERTIDPDGSDLGSALETALELLPADRPGSILLLSDGEGNGRDPIPVARRAFARGVRIDVRRSSRPRAQDLSVERIDLPEEVGDGEPFQFSVWVRADRRVESDFLLEREGTVLVSGRRVFEEGLNRLLFRDRVEGGGVAVYRVALSEEGDRVPENNRGLGAVRVAGPRSVLVINDRGEETSLVAAIRSAGMPVRAATPEGARLDPVSLTSHRAVVLENVAAGRLGLGTDALRHFVLERGGGLLLTGGRASFGIGGYFRSPLDEILPVSMELRQENRKQAIALAIALDRSGSMSASVAGGLTKMDLANEGTAAAIELLSPMDEVAVVAVDSSPHVIQERTSVDSPVPITARVRQIRSMGGGIFCRTAIESAAGLLAGAKAGNRHIILFSDAADSEEQEGCPGLVADLVRDGVTLSVIALGSETDSDAGFLRTIARIGEGEIHFTSRPEELPRLFAADTMRVARSTFVEERTGTSPLPSLFALGPAPPESFPDLDGYNLTYARPGATLGAVTQDENRAPVFALRHAGIGRTAAFTGEVGGKYGKDVVTWGEFSTFFATAGRWLAGQEEPEEYFPSVRLEGKEAVISVEIDAAAPAPPDTSRLAARMTDPAGDVAEVQLERIDERRFEARVPIDGEGIWLGTVRLGEDRFVSLPPVALPYSPEFERSTDPLAGERLLRRIAEESGGEMEVTAGAFFRGGRKGKAVRPLGRELGLAALFLLMLEIAGRRFPLWNMFRIPRGLRRRADRVASSVVSKGAEPLPSSRAAAPPTSAPPPPRPAPSLPDALERAKRAAGRELER